VSVSFDVSLSGFRLVKGYAPGSMSGRVPKGLITEDQAKAIVAYMKTLEGNFLSVRIPIEKDGVYHFSAKNGSEVIRLSQDYFIESQMDQGPKVRITHPGPDARVNPIEEVIVKVEGDDDYGLTQLKLHYSVNGQPEKVIDRRALEAWCKAT